jgi:hypothetical protein
VLHRTKTTMLGMLLLPGFVMGYLAAAFMLGAETGRRTFDGTMERCLKAEMERGDV